MRHDVFERSGHKEIDRPGAANYDAGESITLPASVLPGYDTSGHGLHKQRSRNENFEGSNLEEAGPSVEIGDCPGASESNNITDKRVNLEDLLHRLSGLLEVGQQVMANYDGEMTA